MTPKHSAITTILLTLISSFAHAQITEIRQFHGEEIYCSRSGLHGFASSCGIIDSYEHIFIGSVLSITQVSESEKRLELKPQEVFLGSPADLVTVTVTTNDADCFGDLQAGDEWLFYLQRDHKTKELLLSYGSPSAPIAEADRAITRVRRLSKMSDSGIIIGSVQNTLWHEGSMEYVNVPNHKIVAKRESDGAEYSTSTNTDGDYEFSGLPIGSYDLSANTAPGLWAEQGTVDVRPRGCSWVRFELSPDGQISGHVRSLDGKPFEIPPRVELVCPDRGESNTAFVDEQGYYEFRGLRPGRYLIGIGVKSEPGTPEWRSRVYFPGVRAQRLAAIISLGQGEKRTGVDLLFNQPKVIESHEVGEQ